MGDFSEICIGKLRYTDGRPNPPAAQRDDLMPLGNSGFSLEHPGRVGSRLYGFYSPKLLEENEWRIREQPWRHSRYAMVVNTQTSFYLPPGYQVERTRGVLVLRRPDGSVTTTLGGQQAIGEIVERYAWEDSAKGVGSRIEGGCERYLELPTPIIIGLLWLVGAVPVGLCAAVLYFLWDLLMVALTGG